MQPMHATSGSFASPVTCHNYVLISARGTFEVQGPSIAFTGMINAVMAARPVAAASEPAAKTIAISKAQGVSKGLTGGEYSAWLG